MNITNAAELAKLLTTLAQYIPNSGYVGDLRSFSKALREPRYQRAVERTIQVLVEQQQQEDNSRRSVPIEEAIRRIGLKSMVHTFMEVGLGLIGADHRRESLIAAMKRHGVEDAGSEAAKMGHTLVIVKYPLDDTRTMPLFIEALPPEVTR